MHFSTIIVLRCVWTQLVIVKNCIYNQMFTVYFFQVNSEFILPIKGLFLRKKKVCKDKLNTRAINKIRTVIKLIKY